MIPHTGPPPAPRGPLSPPPPQPPCRQNDRTGRVIKRDADVGGIHFRMGAYRGSKESILCDTRLYGTASERLVVKSPSFNQPSKRLRGTDVGKKIGH